MSTTIGNLAVLLTANAAGFTSGFAAAQKTAGSFMGTLGMMAKSALPLIGIGSAVGVINTAFKGFTGAEESRLTFQALLGSADKAKAFKAELKDFGDMTSFGDGVGAAAKELLKFNFSQESILPVLRQLGDVAAGVNVPLEELASVVGKSGYRANISGKQLIALTEMGVPIMQELSRTMNLSQGSITQLAEQGGIKFDDLMGAMKSATSEGGNFFGMMEARANTTKGLMGRIIDQTGDVIGKFGSMIGDRFSAVFGVKSGMGAIFDWLQNVEEGIKNLGPLFDNWFLYLETLSVVASSVWDGVTKAFQTGWAAISGVFGSFGDTFGAFRDYFIEGCLAVQFVFKNFGAIMEYEFELIKLGLFAFGADAVHLFTVNIPEILGWFSRNWRQVFTDMYNYTVTVFSNIGKNIWEFIKNIPGLIAGTVSFGDIWTPLTDGFKSSITEALVVTKRGLTEYERQALQKTEGMREKLSQGWTQALTEGMARFKAPAKGFFETLMGGFGGMVGGKGRDGLSELGAKSKSAEIKRAGAFDAGSKEAYNVVLRSRDMGLAPANRTAKATEDIAKSSKTQEKLLADINKGITDTSTDFGMASLDPGGAS